jgi:DNA-binding MarR family transcriptional regulator
LRAFSLYQPTRRPPEQDTGGSLRVCLEALGGVEVTPCTTDNLDKRKAPTMPATTSTTTIDAVLAALQQQPDATTAELAAAAELGRSTVGKALAALERDGRVHRTPGGHDGGRRRPDRWTPPPAAEAAAVDAQPDTTRLRKGQLRALVLEHLQQHADVEHSPTAVAKTLGRSAAEEGETNTVPV